VKDNGRSPAQLVTDLKQAGVLVNAVGARRFRAVTHLDISGEDIEEAGHLFSTVLTR
jgi:threonine aldolase